MERVAKIMSPASDEKLEAAERDRDSISGRALQRNNGSFALYIKWSIERKVSSKENFPLPSKEDLLTVSIECVDYWMAKFIFEVRKDDETRYPRNNLISI